MQHTGAIAPGQLLVATQPGRGGYFDRSVVLLLEHNEESTVGVCLHQPSDTPVGEILDGFATQAATPGVIFEGGPVNTEIMLAIGEPEGTTRDRPRPPRHRPPAGSRSMATSA